MLNAHAACHDSGKAVHAPNLSSVGSATLAVDLLLRVVT